MDSNYDIDTGVDVGETESLDGYTEPVEGEAISAEVLDGREVLDVSLPEMSEEEQASFDEFDMKDAIEGGIISESELQEVEAQSLKEINDAMSIEDQAEIPTMTQNDVEWLIEEGNLNADELSALKGALDSGAIQVEPDELPEEPEGIARVRK